MDSKVGRREFIKLGAAVGAGLALGNSNIACGAKQPKGAPTAIKAEKLDVVRVGFVGVGLQGTSHLRNYLNCEGVEVKAVCDIVPAKVERAQQLVEKAGQAKPAGYSDGDYDFKRLCERDDLDLVFTITPWEWHVPVLVAAMEAGKHAATEVPAAVTLEECWQMVETSERTNRHCIQMENCCYDRPEMVYLNMARKGLLGELLHGEGGYMHDLRHTKTENRNEGLWRGKHSADRNGNLYPTHGLGPLATAMDINHGDKFDYLVSMSTPARGLNLYAKEHLGPDNPNSKLNFINGDVNSSIIKTANGLTIIVQHDCDTPRPYSRINIIQGTKGIFQGYPDQRVYIEGRSPEHQWEMLDAYMDEWDHPLWKTVGARSRKFGHGGMDFLEDYRLVEALRTGRYPDYDVYDAAALSAVTELSEKSVANKSQAVDFPDFTRGQWQSWDPIFVTDL